MSHVVVERELAGRVLKIETGKWAKQASGSAVVSMGDTVVLAATADQEIRPGGDFFPLTVDYRERGYAAGLIFGGRYMKRESRPSEKEILTMRLIDRPIRPLWPDGYSRDVLIQCLALSAEPDVDPDVAGMIAAAASLSLSPLPFQGPTGSVRVGKVNDEYVLFPTVEQMKESSIELVVSGTKSAVLMVEAGAQEASEEEMVQAIEFGHGYIKQIVEMVEELVAKAQPVKQEFVPAEKHPIFQVIHDEYFQAFKDAACVETKFGRRDARRALRDEIVEKYALKEGEEDESKPTDRQVKDACEETFGKVIRKLICEGKRCDGRSKTDIRPISCEVGVLPRTHGSALFTRGETQSLASTTLGTSDDEQLSETLRGEITEKFLLHYNFPSFCVGEVKMPRGPGRREIGHGALAKRAVKAALPEYESFPYMIRNVSEILESNGSSSMATVCGSTLALMDAGVPMKAPVAGIAMGLVDEDGDYHIVSDILGDEDHYGDMDFKVAGTANGITALQMDIKSSGVPADVMRTALDQAKGGREHILAQMAKVLAEPRDNVSKHAPKIIQLKVDVEKIGKLIGPGGKMIRSLEEKYGVTITVSDDGSVAVASPKRDQAEEAATIVEGITGSPEPGRTYMGEVVNIKEFGVFFEIMPGVDGLCHVSELDTSYVKNTADFCKVGDKMEVKLIAVDDLGRLKLSRKALLQPEGEGGDEKRERRPRRPSGDRKPRERSEKKD